VLAAMREAAAASQAMAAQHLGKVTGGMGLPGMF